MDVGKWYVKWYDVFKELEKIDFRDQIVYGVPKGGMICAGFLKKAKNTNDPGEATIILDDILDSGKTKEHYETLYPNKRFHYLFDREKFPKIDEKAPWIVFPWEAGHPAGEETVEQNVTRQLQFIGEDVNREGLLDTPKRVIKAWKELFKGYKEKPEDVVTVFNSDNCDQIVLLKDIEFYSMCEHHLLPFYGKAHVAYIPDKKVIGISKLARLVDIYARRAQIQERIGEQVTTALMEVLKPKGAACVLEATHTCMTMRGVCKQHSIMVTSSVKGVFMSNPSAKEELMQLLQK